MAALTVRAACCGILLGCAVCFANTYFGLQAGFANSMNMQSALLAFALFRSMRKFTSVPLSPGELTVIEVTAAALGLVPFTSGYIAFIPALEFLVTDDQGESIHFSLWQLLAWSLATCGLGLVVAPPFRRLFILRERLRFPSGTATGTLIGVLFGKSSIISRADQELVPLGKPSSPADGLPAEEEPQVAGHRRESSESIDKGLSDADVSHSVHMLLISLAGSAAFGLLSYFLPVLRSLPIFGTYAAQKWKWSYDLSPAYIGYGMIIGPEINASMLIGAIVGWGILSPVAKHHGWAPGPVNDFDTGSRGWILWIGMGLILGDSIVGLGWLVVRLVASPFIRQFAAFRRPELKPREEAQPLLGADSGVDPQEAPSVHGTQDEWPRALLATWPFLLSICAALLVLYFATLFLLFRRYVTVASMFVPVIFLVPAAFISMRSLGETDSAGNIAIGRLAQFILGLIVNTSGFRYTATSLLMAGAVEGGANQSSQHMAALRTSYITETPPLAAFYGQGIGTIAGTLVATLVYRAYTGVKEIPSDEFAIPDAHLWLVIAKFVRQQGLPPRATEFAAGAVVVGAVLSTLRILAGNARWKSFVPSGIAAGIGMYIVPAITLARAMGSVVLVVSGRYGGMPYFVLMCAATGLILGQGLFSILSLVFDAFAVF